MTVVIIERHFSTLVVPPDIELGMFVSQKSTCDVLSLTL